MMPPNGQFNPQPPAQQPEREPTSSGTASDILKSHIAKQPDPQRQLAWVQQAESLRQAIQQYRELREMGFTGLPEGLDAVTLFDPSQGLKGLMALLETTGTDQGRIASATLGQMLEAFGGPEPPRDARKVNAPHYSLGMMSDKYLGGIQEALEDILFAPEAATQLPSDRRQQYADLLGNVRRIRSNWGQSQGSGIQQLGQLSALDDEFSIVDAISSGPDGMLQALKSIEKRRQVLRRQLRNYDFQAARDIRANARMESLAEFIKMNRAHERAIWAGDTAEADRIMDSFGPTLQAIRTKYRGQAPLFPDGTPVPTQPPAQVPGSPLTSTPPEASPMDDAQWTD